jgi:hypothetical protein
MINAHALSTSDCEPINEGPLFCLQKNIAAIQVLPTGNSEEPRLGMITQLPAGAELQVCGEGFNERTMKVQWAGGLYFVFLQDVDSPLTMQAAL